jgi:AAA domain-containing protein
MASAATLRGESLRILIGGWPKGGKTGAIASLLNAGYKVRMLDFEGNYDVLLNYVKPEAIKNLDIATFQDKQVSDGATAWDSADSPKDMAYSKALQQMKDWKSVDDDGKPMTLGPSFQWGPDTVVVVDNLTRLGEMSFRRARRILNKKAGMNDVKVWGLAVDELVAFLGWLTRKTNKFHLVVLAHWQMLGPDVPMSAASEDEDIKDLKKQIATERAAMLETKLFPKGVTKENSRNIGSLLPVLLEAKRVVNGSKVKRVLLTETDEAVDLAFPVPGAEKSYPIDTGLATIFELLGAKAPGLK